MQLPFDPEDPPATPPSGANPSIWRLAHQVFGDHQPGTDGWCITCREPRSTWPCKPAGAARRGLLLSLAAQYRKW